MKIPSLLVLWQLLCLPLNGELFYRLTSAQDDSLAHQEASISLFSRGSMVRVFNSNNNRQLELQVKQKLNTPGIRLSPSAFDYLQIDPGATLLVTLVGLSPPTSSYQPLPPAPGLEDIQQAPGPQQVGRAAENTLSISTTAGQLDLPLFDRRSAQQPLMGQLNSQQRPPLRDIKPLKKTSTEEIRQAGLNPVLALNQQNSQSPSAKVPASPSQPQVNLPAPLWPQTRVLRQTESIGNAAPTPMPLGGNSASSLSPDSDPSSDLDSAPGSSYGSGPGWDPKLSTQFSAPKQAGPPALPPTFLPLVLPPPPMEFSPPRASAPALQPPPLGTEANISPGSPPLYHTPLGDPSRSEGADAMPLDGMVPPTSPPPPSGWVFSSPPPEMSPSLPAARSSPYPSSPYPEQEEFTAEGSSPHWREEAPQLPPQLSPAISGLPDAAQENPSSPVYRLQTEATRPKRSSPMQQARERYFIQVGVYRRLQAVSDFIARYGAQYSYQIERIQLAHNAARRCLLGPFSLSQARAILTQVRKRVKDAYLVNGS